MLLFIRLQKILILDLKKRENYNLLFSYYDLLHKLILYLLSVLLYNFHYLYSSIQDFRLQIMFLSFFLLSSPPPFFVVRQFMVARAF